MCCGERYESSQGTGEFILLRYNKRVPTGGGKTTWPSKSAGVLVLSNQVALSDGPTNYVVSTRADLADSIDPGSSDLERKSEWPGVASKDGRGR